MRFVKPLDTDLLLRLADSHDALVTIEENALAGGAGSACAEALEQAGRVVPMLRMGLPDHFIDHGDHGRLLKAQGLDAEGIENAVRTRFADVLREPRLLKKAG